jgi:Spy/CpxP family protein refolding chaperone
MQRKTFRQRLALVAAGAAMIGSFAFASTASAQDQQQGGDRPRDGQRFDPAQRQEQRIARMTETLQLNQSQVTRIRAILTDERTQMEAFRKNNPRPDDRAGQGSANGGQRPDGGQRPQGGRGGFGGRRELPPELKAIRDKTDKQIESVLTPQQLSTYRAQQAERAKREGGERQGRSNA